MQASPKMLRILFCSGRFYVCLKDEFQPELLKLKGSSSALLESRIELGNWQMEHASEESN